MNVSIPSSFPCQSPSDPTIFDFGGLVSAPRYGKAALSIERPSRPRERSDQRKPYQIISNGTSGAGGRGIPTKRKAKISVSLSRVSLAWSSQRRGVPAVGGVGRSLPAEISEFLVNALKSHDDDEGCDGGKRGRLERTERTVSEGGGNT